jgi:hypothetical protein
MRGIILALVAIVAMGCGGKRIAGEPDKGPDTSGVLAVMGKIAVGHACPISSNLAITAAHVIDPRPFDKDVPLQGSRWSAAGQDGVLTPEGVVIEVDLGFVSSPKDFPIVYEKAEGPPAEGEKLWLVGYDWSNTAKAFAEKRLEVKVLRIVAGHVIFDRAGEGGSSGSCVLNAQGKLVAINVAGMGVGFNEEVGIAVGVWGDTFNPKRTEPEETK